jgi:hypothetical protein
LREYLIATPGYASMCGGIKSLHKLAHMLNQRGYKAYVTGDYCNPEFNTPMAKLLSQEHLRDLQHNGIIVYPDIVPNNPCKFTHVVKYWLGITQNATPNTLQFTMSEHHKVIDADKVFGTLMIWHVENFFKLPDVEDRKSPCWYPGKGGNLPKIEGLDHGTFITAGLPPTRQELAHILQHATIFYTYDSCTVLIQEARLCGCPVQIVGFWPFDKERIKQDPFGTDGVRYLGDEIDLEKMKSELSLFRERYAEMEAKTEKELDIFIEATQSWNPNNIFVEDNGPYLHTIYGHQNFDLWKTR